MIDRIAYDHRTAPPHAVVGIFIVKNSRETIAARFCNRRSASRCWHARVRWRASDVIGWPRLACAQQKTRRGIPPGRLA